MNHIKQEWNDEVAKLEQRRWDQREHKRNQVSKGQQKAGMVS